MQRTVTVQLFELDVYARTLYSIPPCPGRVLFLLFSPVRIVVHRRRRVTPFYETRPVPKRTLDLETRHYCVAVFQLHNTYYVYTIRFGRGAQKELIFRTEYTKW